MPSPQDLVYKQAFDDLIKSGYSHRDAEAAGAEAVRLWRRNTTAREAVSQAIIKTKKVATK
jgi:hypothetical protein